MGGAGGTAATVTTTARTPTLSLSLSLTLSLNKIHSRRRAVTPVRMSLDPRNWPCEPVSLF